MTFAAGESMELPIQEAITGNEQSPDLRQPQDVLAEFYRALNTRDMALMERNWAHTAEATMDNPLGGIKRGWDEIRSVYDRLFQFDGQYHFEFYDYTLHTSGDIFYAVGRERGYVTRRGIRLEMKIRTTRVFQSADGRWRQIHHHGSIDDPQLLAEYQATVLR
jgi:ketosteroid isomerase-like protein